LFLQQRTPPPCGGVRALPHPLDVPPLAILVADFQTAPGQLPVVHPAPQQSGSEQYPAARHPYARA